MIDMHVRNLTILVANDHIFVVSSQPDRGPFQDLCFSVSCIIEDTTKHQKIQTFQFHPKLKHFLFPLLGAYYLSFYCAQCQSSSKAGIYLPRSVSAYGHLYFGFSMVGDPTQVSVYTDQKEFYNGRQFERRENLHKECDLS